jgi:hypothetical protein
MALSRTAIPVLVAVIVFASTGRGAAVPAALPPGLAATGSTSVGTFISATLTDSESYDPEQKKLRDAENDCVGRGMTLQIEGDRAAFGRKSLWLYLTADHEAEFSEISHANIDSEHCVATVKGERTIHQRPRDKKEGIVAYPFAWSETIPACRKGCERKKMAGVDAQCYSHGSLFFSATQCLSIGPRAVRGYLLLDSSQDDTFQGSTFEVTALDGNAEIDNAVFDWAPDWARNLGR